MCVFFGECSMFTGEACDFRGPQSMGIFCSHCWWCISQAVNLFFFQFVRLEFFCKISVLASVFVIISWFVGSWIMLQITNLCEVQAIVLNSQGRLFLFVHCISRDFILPCVFPCQQMKYLQFTFSLKIQFSVSWIVHHHKFNSFAYICPGFYSFFFNPYVFHAQALTF